MQVTNTNILHLHVTFSDNWKNTPRKTKQKKKTGLNHTTKQKTDWNYIEKKKPIKPGFCSK